MRKPTLIFWVLFSTSISSNLSSAQDSSSLRLIEEGIRLTILQRFEEAMAKFDSLKFVENNPTQRFFYQAATLQAQMMDREDYSLEDQFMRLIDQTITAADSLLKHDDDRAWACFYKGSALSYKGYYLAQRKRYLPALRSVIPGIKLLEEAISLDSTIYEAYLGVGSYKYWRTRMMRFLHWLPFFPDQRQEGIAMIHKAIEQGRLARPVAISELIWIEIDRHNWPVAISYAKQALQEYPGSRFFLWGLAEAYFRGGCLHQAIKIYQQLLKSYQREKNYNHYNDVICYYRLAQCHHLLREYQTSHQYCQMILELPLAKNVRHRLKKRLKETEKLLYLNQKKLAQASTNSGEQKDE